MALIGALFIASGAIQVLCFGGPWIIVGIAYLAIGGAILVKALR